MILWKQLKKSFGYAFHGLVTVFKTEQSFRLQAMLGIIMVILLFIAPIKHEEQIIVLLLVATVLILEIINSIFERVLDAFKPRLHPIVKEAKDMMAGAVLLMSLFSLVIGFLIFEPYLHLLFW